MVSTHIFTFKYKKIGLGFTVLKGNSILTKLNSYHICCQDPEIHQSKGTWDSNGNMLTLCNLSHFRHTTLPIKEWLIDYFVCLRFFGKSQYNFPAFICCLLISLYKLSDIKTFFKKFCFVSVD